MDRAIGISKASHVAQTLEREIRSGQVAHGDRLDSESALMRRFSVSRNTVRKGLEKLVRGGLITTRTGIGSFVTYGGETIDSALGWTLALSKAGGELETRLLDVRRDSASESSRALNCPDDFLCVDRLRLCPKLKCGVSLERSRLPWRPAFESVLHEGLVDRSLSKTLSSLGIVIASGEHWADVLLAITPADADLMQRPAGEPMLRLRRLNRDRNGEPVEWVESLLDPTRFGLHLVF